MGKSKVKLELVILLTHLDDVEDKLVPVTTEPTHPTQNSDQVKETIQCNVEELAARLRPDPAPTS